MKIDGITYFPDPSQQGQKSTQATPGFGEALVKAVSGEGTPLAGAQGVCASTPLASCDGGASLYYQVTGVLDSIDRYAAALGDPSQTLKDVAPLADELENKAQDLEDSLDPDAQDSLSRLGWQVVTQAQVEAFKFRRGDYV